MKPCETCALKPVEGINVDGLTYSGLECTGCGARSVFTNAPRGQASETAIGALALWLIGEAAEIGYDPDVGVFCCEIDLEEDQPVPTIERGPLSLAAFNPSHKDHPR